LRQIDDKAVEHVRNTINELEPGDEININIESADAHQANPIIDLMEKSNLDYQPRGSHDGKSYFINARKKNSLII